jgi:hypothetical protein
MQESKTVMETNICQDCMHGAHEIIGHPECECSCHNNPECWICGKVLLGIDDIKDGSHLNCLQDYNDAESDQYLDQMLTKYGDELFDRRG